MAELVGEAADQDETFWNDGIWQEAESDAESFVAEEEKPDVFDSDFDESETEEEDDSDDEKAAKRVVPITSSVRMQYSLCLHHLCYVLYLEQIQRTHKGV